MSETRLTKDLEEVKYEERHAFMQKRAARRRCGAYFRVFKTLIRLSIVLGVSASQREAQIHS